MPADKAVTDIDFTKTQLGVLMVTMLLAVDAINPVKIVLHVFPAIAPWHVASVCILLSIYIWISEFKSLLYYSVKIFFQSILSIFFRDVEIIGRDNIPRHGPVLFTINHANQFVDAVTVVCSCPHKISYLMAEASWKRRIVGDLAWALGVVPVKRPQDQAIQGIGTVSFSPLEPPLSDEGDDDDDNDNGGEKDEGGVDVATGNVENNKTVKNQVNNNLVLVNGKDTKFTQQLAKGDKIRPPGTSLAVKITEIVDDVQLVVDGSEIEKEQQGHIFFDASNKFVTFDILKRVDQKVVYSKVLDRLASGGCVGIFPEGGSHDRTDLLPLKVGVALIAYSALEKDGINVPIVPVGLNYFSAHRWRGRAVVEYGRPIYIDPSTLADYKNGGADKRRVCNELLERIEDSMKSVIVSAPDYESLQIIHTARRLYQRKGLQSKEKQDLARRFAEGYKRLLLMVEGDPPKQWLNLQKRIIEYQRELRDLGIRDYQVLGMDREDPDLQLQDIDGDRVLKEIRLPYQIVHLLFLISVAAIPTVFLNLPVGILAGLYSESRRKRALAKSKVKVRGFDVMLTEKIMFCIVAIPTMWFIYFLILFLTTDFDGPTIALCMLSLPVFAYMGIITSEAGMVEWKDLKPYFMRLYPSSRRRMKRLPAVRRQLQADLRAFIRHLAPALGEIYYGKELDWKEILQKTRRTSSFASIANAAAAPASAAAAAAAAAVASSNPEVKKYQ